MNRVIAFVIVCGSVLLLIVSTSYGTKTLPEIGVGNERAWAEHIRVAGPAIAYADFAKAIESEPAPTQHQAAHFFGAALFEAVGASGLSTCDSRFSFGCFHEFLGHAIRDLGLSVVYDLNEGCREALGGMYLSCQHGIGHGVYAHFGYDEPALFKALDVCRSLPDADVIGGCYGGVFMEYNMRTMWGNSATTRPANEDVQYPCSAVGDVYAPACLYWQAQWWVHGLHGADTDRLEVMRKVGGYCAESRDRPNCFEGIGNILLAESRDERGNPSNIRAREFCKVAALTPGDELHCLSVAANHFGLDVSIADGKEVCADLPMHARAYCEQHATNEANIARRIPFPYDEL